MSKAKLESAWLACRWMFSTTAVLNPCQARNDSGSLTPNLTGLVTTIQNSGFDFARIARRQGDGSAYDLGPGLYMTDSLATAQQFASANAALAGSQSPSVVVVEVSNGRWWWLRWRYGALDRVPISNMEGQTQNFVSPDGVPSLNRYAIFYLGEE
jgi:hypothetical protein